MRASLFSAPAAAAAQSAGLAPVGEVFGCVVMNLGWSGIGCGWYGSTTSGRLTSSAPLFMPQPSPVLTSGRGGRNSGMTPYVKAVEAGWSGALRRLLAEAAALGAHGVVGVRLERTHLVNHVWEFTALGTAVRSTDPILAPRPTAGEVWSTDLSAEDTASAILSGFLPREIVFGLSVSTKHEDWLLRNQRTGWVNLEVEGMTELITAARDEARDLIATRAARGGGSQLVISTMGLREFETSCSSVDGEDLHAEAIFIGTTLTPVPRFRAPETARVLPILPLRGTRPPKGTHP